MKSHSTAVASQVWHFKFVGFLLVYNIVIFLIFLPIYIFLDFSKHFISEKPATLGDKFYFCMMTHSNAMAGDFVPKSKTARTVMSFHILMTWLQLMFVFFAAQGGHEQHPTDSFIKTAASKANFILANARKVAQAVR